MSLRFFTARMQIWFPLSGVFLLTNLPGLQITSHLVAMSSSDRLARVHGESIPWSSTSFMVTVWLNPSLRNISSISPTMVGGGLGVAGASCTSGAVSATSSSFCSSASLEDFLRSSASQSSLSGGTGISCPSCLSLIPCDEFARFALLVGLNLIRGTSCNIPGNTNGTQRVLWLTVYSKLFPTTEQQCLVIDMIATSFIACKDALFGINSSLFTTCNG